MITVLLVEDEELLLQELALTTPWKELGCSLAGEAQDGIRGLELLLRLKPEILITDIRIPGIDGLEMLKKATELLPEKELPVALILSGYPDFQYAQQAVRLGVQDYLLKPVDDSELYAALRRLVEHVRARQKEEALHLKLKRIENGRNFSFREYELSEQMDTKESYLASALQFIYESYNLDISLDEVARTLGITASYLSHIFKEKTDYTFLDHLNRYRIHKAITLLKDRTLRINEVARKSGFRDCGYFSQTFKKYTGMTPSVFRNGGER